MLPDYNDKPSAAIDHLGIYYSITAYCLTLKEDSPIDVETVCRVLNSKLTFWFLGKVGTALQRGFVRFMPQYLDKVPIPRGSFKLRKESLDADLCAALGIEPAEWNVVNESE